MLSLNLIKLYDFIHKMEAITLKFCSKVAESLLEIVQNLADPSRFAHINNRSTMAIRKWMNLIPTVSYSDVWSCCTK